MIKNWISYLAVAFIIPTLGFAQLGNVQLDAAYFEELRTLTTAVPIIAISPDSRAGGMGDVGVASTADANSIYWNPAKIAFLKDGTNSLSLSYTPWLNSLASDINLAYIAYAYKVNENQGLSLAMRYFSLGDIAFTDIDGNSLGIGQPYEMTMSGAYALKLNRNMSLAVGLRWIFSDLASGNTQTSNDITPGSTVAGDLGFYYESREYNMEGGMKQSFALGVNLSNIGGKINYGNDISEDFIPANLRLGGAYHLKFDKYNRMSFMADINKLLVPTPPIREGQDGFRGDQNGNGVENDQEVLFGKDDDVSALSGVFQSFNDAPGGFSEELEEVVINTGVEFWYDNRFALRGGYQYEDAEKGNRKYFTIGLGLRYNVFGLDFAYLIPASATVQSPLENTLRFTLLFDFGNGADQ